MRKTIFGCFLFSLLFSIIPVFAQSDTNLADLAAITRADGVTLHIESFTYQDTAGRYTPANGVYLVMLMTIENPTDDQQCIRARDIRLLFNGDEYPPEAALMGAVQREIAQSAPRRDFVGPFAGHCVPAGESVASFAAFDIPADLPGFSITFDDMAQAFTVTDNTVEVDLSATATPLATGGEGAGVRSDTADAQTLMDGIALLAGGRDVQSVQIANGRDKGGERSALITYTAHETESTAFLGEFIDILRAAAATIRAKKLDLDSIILIIGTEDGMATGMITTQVDDLLDFHQGRLSLSEYIDKLTITDL